MKFIAKLVLLAGPLLALPTEAFAWGSCGSAGCSSCGWHLCGLNPFNVHGCLAGPWYSYWPYEAHFTAGAPVACSYPFWGGAAPSFGEMSAFPPAAAGMGHMGHAGAYGGDMGQFGAYAGNVGYPGGGMGYPGGAGYSYPPTSSWPTSGAANGFPVTGMPAQGSGYWPGH